MPLWRRRSDWRKGELVSRAVNAVSNPGNNSRAKVDRLWTRRWKRRAQAQTWVGVGRGGLLAVALGVARGGRAAGGLRCARDGEARIPAFDGTPRALPAGEAVGEARIGAVGGIGAVVYGAWPAEAPFRGAGSIKRARCRAVAASTPGACMASRIGGSLASGVGDGGRASRVVVDRACVRRRARARGRSTELRALLTVFARASHRASGHAGLGGRVARCAAAAACCDEGREGEKCERAQGEAEERSRHGGERSATSVLGAGP